MTIRRRLLISHVTMFIVPIMMTAIVFLSAFAGLLVFIRSGNHVYIESGDQFSHASEILYYAVFHGKKTQADVDDTGRYDWLVQVLNPEQNYVRLVKNGQTVYQYGNDRLAALLQEMPPPEDVSEAGRPDKGSYVKILGNDFSSFRKRTAEGAEYGLYFVSRQAPHGTDDRLETVGRGTLFFILIAMAGVIGLTSWFLSQFMIRRLLPPLSALRKGAEKIQQGDLDVEMRYENQDEFSPVFAAFRKMAKELAASLRQRTEEETRRKELIASISHDIRTPLTAIKAYVEGLSDGVADTEDKRRKYLGIIRKKTEELDQMVEELFLLSKLDVGAMAFPLSEIPLGEFAADLAEENRDALAKEGMCLSVRSEAGCRIAGHPQLLKRILLNLWGNSAKYKMGKTGHIHTKIEKTEGCVRLTATDDGPGVPEEALPHLFEPFYRTDKARSRTGDGSGLGLAVAARGMAQMGGTVCARLAKPHGLQVVLEWPLMEGGRK